MYHPIGLDNKMKPVCTERDYDSPFKPTTKDLTTNTPSKNFTTSCPTIATAIG